MKWRSKWTLNYSTIGFMFHNSFILEIIGLVTESIALNLNACYKFLFQGLPHSPKHSQGPSNSPLRTIKISYDKIPSKAIKILVEILDWYLYQNPLLYQTLHQNPSKSVSKYPIENPSKFHMSRSPLKQLEITIENHQPSIKILVKISLKMVTC